MAQLHHRSASIAALIAGSAAYWPLSQRPASQRHRALNERPPPQGRGRSGYKRRRRAAIATLKGCPGGWKKAVRRIEAEERARARGDA
jgi:hypothetical protein